MAQKIKLSIEEIYARMQENDPDITKGVPNIFKSPVWSKYRCIFYKGHRQDFAQCNSCGKLMLHKARTGNSQLLRHKCATAKKQYRIPNHRYDEHRVAKENHGIVKEEQSSNNDQNNSDYESNHEYNNDSIDETDRSAMQTMYRNEEEFHDEPVTWVKANAMEYKNEIEVSEYSISEQSPDQLSREELSFKIAQKDPSITFTLNNEHPKWKQFAMVFYNGTEQNFLRCVTCGMLLSGDMKSIASLSRHKCPQLDPKPMSPLFSPSLLLQAKLVYKSLRSPELFDDPNFADFCASLVDNQTQPELSNRRKMTDKILPLMVDKIKEDIRAEIRTVNACLSYEIWSWDEHRKIFTLYADWINHEFQLKRYCLGTVLADTVSNKLNLDPLISSILKEYMDDVQNFKKKKCVLIMSHDLSNAGLTDIDVTDMETVTCSLEKLNYGIIKLLEENKSVEYIQALKETYKIKNLKELVAFLENVITTDDPKLDEFLHQLKILREFGNSIANFKETTLDSIFLWKMKLQKHFLANESDEPRLADAKHEFNQMINETLNINDLHKIGVFLNPKFKHLKFVPRQERNEFEDIIMSKINEQLLEVGLDPNTFEIRTMSDTQNEPKGNELFAEFMESNPGTFTLADSLKNEVRQYADMKISGNGDLLGYWRHSNFEDLRKLVRKYLMIPACSIQSRINYLNLDKHLIERRKTLDLIDIQNVLFLYHNMP
uniref:CSON012349 protein n=1 Tax=Culicoides sonorensis TaxID=179676 RepID=A0A336M5X2_CULSO